jgi:homoserine kinase type II
MALHTIITATHTQQIADVYQLGAVQELIPIIAGSVNSNFSLRTSQGRFFLRLYEEQGCDGVAFEWQVLDLLSALGAAVPHRLKGPAPDALLILGKPVALFSFVEGEELCHRLVNHSHFQTLGAALGKIHRESNQLTNRRRGRFTSEALLKRLSGISLDSHPELREPVAILHESLVQAQALWPTELAEGLIHGDLFRDNVLWRGVALVAILDWESASYGAFLFDLMIVIHAWTFRDDFDWPQARAFLAAYQQERPLEEAERRGLRAVAMFAACRFAVTRITDFYLRPNALQSSYRDYRRFLQRLEIIQSMTNEDLCQRLL